MTTEPNTAHPPTGPQGGHPTPVAGPNTPEPNLQAPNAPGPNTPDTDVPGPPTGTGSAKPASPFLLVALGAVGGILVGGAGTALALTSDFSGNPFPEAVAECGLERSPNAELSEDGRTLVLDHKGQEDATGLNFESVDCVLAELEVPANVSHEMEKTRALDGRQSASWEGIEASWSYHPDTGLDVVLTRP